MKRITAFMLLLFFAIAPTMNVFAESETKTEAEQYKMIANQRFLWRQQRAKSSIHTMKTKH